MLNEYTIKIAADAPPDLRLGQLLAGGKIVAIAEANDAPDFVSVTWLANKFNLSRSTIINRCQSANVGTNGKHIYNRIHAIQLINNPNPQKRGRKRKN